MKFLKKALIIVSSLFLLLIVLLVYLVITLGSGGIKLLIEDGAVMSQKNNICLHFHENPGSSESLNMFTYPCDKKINWTSPSVIYSPFREYSKQGMLDVEASGECINIYLKDEGNPESKTLYLKQSFECKILTADNPRIKERHYKVNEKGEFVLIYSK